MQFFHVAIQALAQAIKYPFALALLGQHGAVFADPVPLDEAQLVLLVVDFGQSHAAEADEARVLDPLLVRVAPAGLGFEVVGRAADGQREFARQVGLVGIGFLGDFLQRGRVGAVVVLVGGARAEAFGHAFAFGRLVGFFLDPPEKPGVFFEKCAPYTRFWQDRPVGEAECTAFE